MMGHAGKQRVVSRMIEAHGHSPIQKNRGNFRFNTISALSLGVFLGIGLGLQGAIMTLPESAVVAQIAAGVLAGAVLLFILPYWPMVIALIATTWATLPVLFDVDLQLLAGVVSIGFLLSPGLEVIISSDDSVYILFSSIILLLNVHVASKIQSEKN